MRKLVLRNSQWLRGKRTVRDFIGSSGGVGGSSLLTGESHPFPGQSCCLGIDALDRGVSPDYLLNKGYFTGGIDPLTISCWQDWHQDQNNVAKINDNELIGDDERLDLLRTYFEKRGIELIFDPDS